MNESHITVVREAFVVLSGLAVAVFLTGTGKGTVVDTDPAFKTAPSEKEVKALLWIRAQLPKLRLPQPVVSWLTSATQGWLKCMYVASYIMSLIIIVTLILRFLVGSQTQLTQTYKDISDVKALNRFVTDTCFLMFFGAFLVKVADSRRVRGFLGWLALISGVGVLWSAIALVRGDRGLPTWWFFVNLLQCALTWRLAASCDSYKKGAQAKGGRGAALKGLFFSGIWFMLAFYFDLQMIIMKKLEIFGVRLLSI